MGEKNKSQGKPENVEGASGRSERLKGLGEKLPQERAQAERVIQVLGSYWPEEYVEGGFYSGLGRSLGMQLRVEDPNFFSREEEEIPRVEISDEVAAQWVQDIFERPYKNPPKMMLDGVESGLKKVGPGDPRTKGFLEELNKYQQLGLILIGNKEARDRILEAAVSYLESNANVLASSSEEEKAIVNKVLGEVVTDTLDLYSNAGEIMSMVGKQAPGVNFELLIPNWKERLKGLEAVRGERSIGQDVQRIISLEKQVPGLTNFLMEKCGIYEFNRYPEELLIAQLEQFEDKESPYGVLIGASRDRRGAFSAAQKSLGELHKRLKKLGYNLRITECGSKMELARALVVFNQRYGENQKISFAILEAHANKGLIQLGRVKKGDEETERVNALRVKDFLGQDSSGASRYFVDNPPLIFTGCDAGQKGGVAGQIGVAMKARVIAPRSKASFVNIKPYPISQGLGFEVTFKEEGEEKIYKA